MNPILVIPARYQSSRFPGKPLADIAGKSLIHRVWEQCIKALFKERVFVATDDDRIKIHCEEHGIPCVMTSESCLTGTDRVFESSRNMDIEHDYVINVQGDEPLVRPSDIQKVAQQHEKRPDFIHCGMCRIETDEDFRDICVPKVVARSDGRMLYMSRGAVPTTKKLEFVPDLAMKQVCIYAFPKNALQAYYKYGKSGRKAPLEKAEDIEILRFSEMGYEIEMVRVSQSAIAVDRHEDIERILESIKNRRI